MLSSLEISLSGISISSLSEGLLLSGVSILSLSEGLLLSLEVSSVSAGLLLIKSSLLLGVLLSTESLFSGASGQ
ncbi:hypothetical protein [Clostridium botulinum]|nr:hypothetical protein [Clostridium botulinum]